MERCPYCGKTMYRDSSRQIFLGFGGWGGPFGWGHHGWGGWGHHGWGGWGGHGGWGHHGWGGWGGHWRNGY